MQHLFSCSQLLHTYLPTYSHAVTAHVPSPLFLCSYCTCTLFSCSYCTRTLFSCSYCTRTFPLVLMQLLHTYLPTYSHAVTAHVPSPLFLCSYCTRTLFSCSYCTRTLFSCSYCTRTFPLVLMQLLHTYLPTCSVMFFVRLCVAVYHPNVVAILSTYAYIHGVTSGLLNISREKKQDITQPCLNPGRTHQLQCTVPV